METIKGLMVAVLLFLGIRFLVLEPCIVEGRSMEPEIPSHGIVLVNKLAYGIRIPGSSEYLFQWGQPRQEDILLLIDPWSDTLSIKRCTESTPSGFFLRGDNPILSVDSRLYGSVPMERILGKVILMFPGRGR